MGSSASGLALAMEANCWQSCTPAAYTGVRHDSRSGLRPRDPPLLQLAAAKQILALDPTPLAALGELLSELDAVSRREAERAWTKRKGPMARYRLDVATHVAALRRAHSVGARFKYRVDVSAGAFR